MVLPSVTYFGVRNIFDADAGEPAACTVRMVAADDTAAVLAAADGADMVWVESIANPLIVVADVAAIAAGRARAWRAHRGGRDLRDAAAPAAARPRRRHRAALRDQAHRRPLRPAPGRGRVPGRRARGLPRDYRHDHGSIPGRLRGVPRAARPPHARGPARPGRGVGGGARPAPRRAPARREGQLPGPARRPAARARDARAAERVGVDAVLRGGRDRRADRGVPRAPATADPRDQPRRRRVADRAPGALRRRRGDRRARPCAACRSASRTSRTSGPISTAPCAPSWADPAEVSVFSISFIFRPGRYDDEFHRLDAATQAVGRRHGGLPRVGDLVVRRPLGLQRRLLLGRSRAPVRLRAGRPASGGEGGVRPLVRRLPGRGRRGPRRVRRRAPSAPHLADRQRSDVRRRPATADVARHAP